MLDLDFSHAQRTKNNYLSTDLSFMKNSYIFWLNVFLFIFTHTNLICLKINLGNVKFEIIIFVQKHNITPSYDIVHFQQCIAYHLFQSVMDIFSREVSTIFKVFLQYIMKYIEQVVSSFSYLLQVFLFKYKHGQSIQSL